MKERGQGWGVDLPPGFDQPQKKAVGVPPSHVEDEPDPNGIPTVVSGPRETRPGV